MHNNDISSGDVTVIISGAYTGNVTISDGEGEGEGQEIDISEQHRYPCKKCTITSSFFSDSTPKGNVALSLPVYYEDSGEDLVSVEIDTTEDAKH